MAPVDERPIRKNNKRTTYSSTHTITMATRKGATKTVGGKRYRYNGSKWVQIKATGNVTPTSSRTRNRRSSSSTVTNDSNRPRRGGTRTTTDTQRTSTGSAKVTTKPKALPPGNKGGALATTKPGRRRNVNSNTSSSGARAIRGSTPKALPAGSNVRQPTDGRTKPTRRQTAQAKADTAAKGSSSTNTRTGTSTKPTRGRAVTRGRAGSLAGGVIDAGARIASGQNPVKAVAGAGGAAAGGRAGAAAGSKLGAMLGPKGALAGGILGGLTGYMAGGALTDAVTNKIAPPKKKATTYSGPGLKDVKGKPLPGPNKEFKALISSKVPGASTTTTKPPKAKDTPKATPTGSAAPSGGRSGGSGRKPKPVPKTGANDPRNAAYIAARSKLNSKSTTAERDKVRDMGMAIHNKAFNKKAKPAAKTTGSKAKPTKRPLTAPIKNIKDTNFFKKERDKRRRRLSGMPLSNRNIG